MGVQIELDVSQIFLLKINFFCFLEKRGESNPSLRVLRGLLRDPSCGKSLSSAKLTSRDYYLPVLTLLRRFDNAGFILGRHIVSNLLILQGSCALLVSNLELIDVYLRVSSHVVARLLHRLELYLLL